MKIKYHNFNWRYLYIFGIFQIISTAISKLRHVKYLFKYIYKGHDRISVAVRQADKDDNEGNVDEIKQYRDAR